MQLFDLQGRLCVQISHRRTCLYYHIIS